MFVTPAYSPHNIDHPQLVMGRIYWLQDLSEGFVSLGGFPPTLRFNAERFDLVHPGTLVRYRGHYPPPFARKNFAMRLAKLCAKEAFVEGDKYAYDYDTLEVLPEAGTVVRVREVTGEVAAYGKVGLMLGDGLAVLADHETEINIVW